MDAIRYGFLVSVSLFAFSCSQSKTSESVFPNQTSNSACGRQASENRFIVHWEDGSFSVETDSSADEFRKSFVKNNLAMIRHVDHDYTIRLTPQTRISESAEVISQSTGQMNWGSSTIGADAL